MTKESSLNAPMFSVIITHKDRVHLCVRALDSLKRQSFTDFELIVVDDCSTSEVQTLRMEVENMGGFWIQNERPLHVARSRQEGLKRAVGHFVLFHDDDDWLDENALETISNVVSQKCSYPHSFLIRHLRPTGSIEEQPNYPSRAYKGIHDILHRPPALHATVVPRELIRGVDFNTEIRYMIDVHVWIHVFQRAQAWYCHSVVIGTYDQSGLGSVTRSGCKSYMNKHIALKDFRQLEFLDNSALIQLDNMLFNNLFSLMSCELSMELSTSEVLMLCWRGFLSKGPVSIKNILQILARRMLDVTGFKKD